MRKTARAITAARRVRFASELHFRQSWRSIQRICLIVLLGLSGCANHELERSFDDSNAAIAAGQAHIDETEARLQAMIKEERATAHAGILPPDYKQKIDEKFSSTLIDPDSRRIEYLGHPYGGLVCGYVNAKNRMGGYTGRHPFYAVFSATGSLVALHSYSPEELAAGGYPSTDLGGVSDCGF